MHNRRHLILAVMLFGTLGSMAWGQPPPFLFTDDFELGLGSWSNPSGGATALDWSSAQNRMPVGGQYSAYANLSQDRMVHDFGAELMNLRATWYIYDSTMTRAYCEMRAYTGSGYGQGTLEQLVAAGKYNNVDMPGEVWKSNKYQGRVPYPLMGWFNLDAPGSPNRSAGWHRFDVEAMDDGSVRFYVDGILSRIITGASVKNYDCVVVGFGMASSSNGDAWFDGVRVESIQGVLTLNVPAAPVNYQYVRFGQPVMIDLDVSRLARPVNGCQAVLGYSSTYLFAEAGCVAPGGGVWDQLIYNSWDVGSGIPGEIDTAIGMEAYGQVGSDADATVATVTLVAKDVEGTTEVVFRSDPDDIRNTMLSDMSADPIFPARVNSQIIHIDNTPASLNIASAKQGGSELLISLGSTVNAVEGAVSIQVTASDLWGIPAAPIVHVRDSANHEVTTVFVNQSPTGTWNYTTTISPTTANGVATITTTVTDRAGNMATDSDTFNINKHEITGTVELEGLNPPTGGITRTVRFVATGGASAKTWDIAVPFAAGSATGTYLLTDVPAGTTYLSAKTAWNLRRQIGVTYVDDRATGDFTGTNTLLGGDLNESNSVNVLDYSIMKMNWMTSNPVADIDGSGTVNVDDYNLMKGNWFGLGDAP